MLGQEHRAQWYAGEILPAKKTKYKHTLMRHGFVKIQNYTRTSDLRYKASTSAYLGVVMILKVGNRWFVSCSPSCSNFGPLKQTFVLVVQHSNAVVGATLQSAIQFLHEIHNGCHFRCEFGAAKVWYGTGEYSAARKESSLYFGI